jgi:hypothetical protein
MIEKLLIVTTTLASLSCSTMDAYGEEVKIPEHLRTQAEKTFAEGYPYFIWAESDKITVGNNPQFASGSCKVLYERSPSCANAPLFSIADITPARDVETGKAKVGGNIIFGPEKVEKSGSCNWLYLTGRGERLVSGGSIMVFLVEWDGKRAKPDKAANNRKPISNSLKLTIELGK